MAEIVLVSTAFPAERLEAEFGFDIGVGDVELDVIDKDSNTESNVKGVVSPAIGDVMSAVAKRRVARRLEVDT